MTETISMLVPVGPDMFWVDPGSIYVDRAARQRKQVSTKNLTDSIKARGILNPLIVVQGDNDQWKLVAGERRLAAALELELSLVPCRNWASLDQIEAQVIELEENLKRQDLIWQDLVRSIAEIHRLYQGRNTGQTIEATADSLGLSKGNISLCLRVCRDLSDERIAAAASAREAYNILTRRDERAQQAQVQGLFDDLDGPAEQEPAAPPPSNVVALGPTVSASPPVPVSKILDPAKSILFEDFAQWAPRYSGPKFNLLHCDFPYGIEVFSGPAMTGQGHTYNDSPDLYFRLLECLCINLDRLLSLSGHLFFWYSEKNGPRTRQMFRELAPNLIFQPFPLVWVKSDNSGVAADTTRSPRHVYETCLMASRGDRKIVKVVGDAHVGPSDRRLHVSAKPVPVLKHFLTMVVDEHTKLLDPTCGSGNALQAAEALGAQQVLGLEVDENQCGVARMALKQFRTLRSAS